MTILNGHLILRSPSGGLSRLSLDEARQLANDLYGQVLLATMDAEPIPSGRNGSRAGDCIAESAAT